MKKRKNTVFWIILLVLLLCIIIIVVAVILLSQKHPKAQDIPTEEGTIQVFFCPRENCSKVVYEFIATGSDVKCAFYDLSLPEVISAVKMSNAALAVDTNEYHDLGTRVRSNGIMHDKFCIANNSAVLTGSFNPTKGGTEHRNNIVILQSKYLAQNYLEEYAELEKNVNQANKKKVRYSRVMISGILVENYFCPEDKCEEHVVEALRQANTSIYFMTYSFTSNAIGDVLLHKPDVRGIFEKQQLSQYSEYYRLNKTGIPVKVDDKKYLMHNKVFIIDNATVITGSFNPSKNADENNDENIIIIHDKAVVKEYLDAFEDEWNS